MKNKKYHTVGTTKNPNIKVVERGKHDTTNTHIHERSLSWLGTGTSIKRSGVNLVLCVQTLEIPQIKNTNDLKVCIEIYVNIYRLLKLARSMELY